ncbi:hypothetical protein Q5752_006624 [Cryptotrichosporon argae]
MSQPPSYGSTPTPTRAPHPKVAGMSTPRFSTPVRSGTPQADTPRTVQSVRSARSARSARSRHTLTPAPEASRLSSITNLANTLIGSGALAFPAAFASMGLVPGVVSCAFAASTAFFGLWLLSRCASRVGTRPGDEGRKASFNEVARLTFGKGWVMRLFDAAIAIKCFGVSVSYLIICKTLLPRVSLTFSQILRHPLADNSLLLSDRFWLAASMVVIVPLSFLRTLDALRFTSQIALASVAYMVLVVVGWYIIKGADPNRGAVVLARFDTSTLASFPVQVFAFTCAQNLFPIYNELKDKSQRNMNTIVGTSIFSAAAVYEVLGLTGYLTFGSHVASNVIAMYPATSLVVAVGRLGIVLLVGLSYPLQALPCRSCIYSLTSGIIKGKKEPLFIVDDEEDETEPEEADGEEDDPLVPKPAAGAHHVADMPFHKYVGFTIGILVAGFIIAMLVDELEVVLSFVGSTGSTIISFILPGIFYFRLFRDDRGPTKWFALALAVYGVAVMVFCLTFNIVKLSRR